jgi:hypothetical protein
MIHRATIAARTIGNKDQVVSSISVCRCGPGLGNIHCALCACLCQDALADSRLLVRILEMYILMLPTN